MANEAQLRAIGERYGSSAKDYITASNNVLENVLMNHCNEGIKLMRNWIRRKARTRGASTLAQAIHTNPVKVTPTSISVATVSDVDYWDFVDKGVQGVKNKAKAPQSKYKFRNLYVPKTMVESFKQFIAATGSRDAKGKSYIRKNKKKQANIIEQAAKEYAVHTKIGGIKPMKYVEKANNDKRNNQLKNDIRVALSRAIVRQIKG